MLKETIEPIKEFLAEPERAIADYQQAKAQLFDPQGRPVYVDHATRLANLDTEHSEKLAGVIEKTCQSINAEITRLQGQITVLESKSPVDTLDGAELGRANALANFVREDCLQSPLPALAKKLEAAILQNDRVNLFLLARYLPARIEAENQPEELSNGLKAVIKTPQQQTELAKISQMLQRAGETLAPKDHAKVSELQQQVTRLHATAARARGAAALISSSQLVKL